MSVALIGLLIGIIKRNRLALVILPIALIHIYIIYSWWCWNYINGFGSRAMVELYPLLAFPVALCFHYLQPFPPLKKTGYAILMVLIGLNIFQTHQHFTKVLWSAGGNKAYYIDIFGKTELDYNALVALDCNIIQPKGLSFKEQLSTEHFESTINNGIDTTIAFSGKNSFCVRPGFEYSPGIKWQMDRPEKYADDLFRVSAQCRSAAYSTIYTNSHLVVSITRNGQKILWTSVRINNKIRDTFYSVHNGEINQWKEVHFFIPLQGLELNANDQVSVYAWNPSNVPVYVDDLKLEIWGKHQE